MLKAKGPKYARRILFGLFDVFAVLYLLDYVSFYLTTDILESMMGFGLKLNRWSVFRWMVIVYIVYRGGRFAWHRHKITMRLRRKHEELLDKHGRLNEKLKMTQSPTITTAELAEMTVQQLREQLLSQKYAAVDLIDAYQRRALDIFRCRTGCISEIIFDSDVYAILADEDLKHRGEKALSPLHGIPVSVQEFFPVRGYDHTMGYTSRVHKPAEDDCALVAALKTAGAIPFVLTNFRQKVLGVTSENPIFGRTKHPTHPHRACISGDAVLVALGGAPLSFAADLAGDARLAAASCGMAGFKPTNSRMSQKGLDMPIKLPGVLSVVASPIGRTTMDIVDALRSLWTSALFTRDSALCPLSFDEAKFQRGQQEKLKIGFYTGFKDLLPASTAVERVLTETKKMLENEGHTVIEFDPPDFAKAYQLCVSLTSSTLINETFRLIYKDGHGDVLMDYKQRALHAFYLLPKMFQKLLLYSRALRKKYYYPVTSLALRGLASSKPYTELEYEAQQYAQQFFDAWNEHELDCLLCPVSPIPTPWDNSSFNVVNCVFLFTAIYNLIGCPAGCVRAGRVEKSDIDLARDNVIAGPKLRQSLMFTQQLDASEGLPINIQVVTKPWDDELALGLMHTIEQKMSVK